MAKKNALRRRTSAPPVPAIQAPDEEREPQLPEEEASAAPVEAEAVEAEAVEEEAASDKSEPAEPDASPEEAASEPPAAEQVEDPAEHEPQDQPSQTSGRSAEEKSTSSRAKGRRPHPLWRGWWLAIILLGCFVLMGWAEPPGLSWLRQPLRAFAGAVLLGGCVASLPGILKGRKPDKPAWPRCLLALVCGALWGVLA